jgi:PAS domain S-box-containing protein
MYNYNRYDRKMGHNERKLNQSDLIVSKTDMKGMITYANPTFLEISGYHTAELLGINHNIIRHPDMPRALFSMIWNQLNAGKDIYAYVKNLAKDGSFYWTFAYIAPDYNAKGDIIGYHSERRAPNPKAILDITLLYDRLKQLEIQYDIDTAREYLLTTASQQGGSYEHYVYTLQNQH